MKYTGPFGGKVCTGCGEYKLEECYDKIFEKSRGYTKVPAKCKDCRRAKVKTYYHENKDRRMAYNKKWREDNYEDQREKRSKYHKDNRERILSYQKWWRENNPDKVAAARFSRRVNFDNACPSWLTDEMIEEIKSFYILAKDCAAVSGEEYEVDHIVPIKGKNICGLHVPWNLQVLPKDINRSKTNYYVSEW